MTAAITADTGTAAGPRNDRPTIRGRYDDLAAFRQALRGAGHGRGSLLLVEGAAGVGKTRLLDELADLARAGGFRVGRSAILPGDRPMPMRALVAALIDGREPVLDGPARDLRSLRTDASSAIARIEDLLETAARQGPLLVCLDDAHWADELTIAALRVLPARLHGQPIVWGVSFLARRSSDLLDLAAHASAPTVRRRLDTLDDRSAERLITDVVQAVPAPELLVFARRAGGNPALLVELARGLLDEGIVQVRDGRAELTESRIPRRVRDLMHDKLARVSPMARRALADGSILRDAMSFANVAAMLDLPPASLLESIEELVAIGMLLDTGRGLRFPSELVRDAVADTLPGSASQALRRQAIEVLIGAGVSPLEPAAQLAANAEVGDRTTIGALLSAACAVRATAPAAAADLGRRALDLTPRGDNRRPSLVAELTSTLDAAGRGHEARVLIDAILREWLVPEHEAEVRLAAARMSELPADVRIATTSQTALALPDVPITGRARHLSQLVLNISDSGRPGSAMALLPEAETAVGSSGDRSAAFVLAAARSQLSYMDGAFHGALRRLDASVSDLRRDVASARQVAERLRAELLLALGRFDEAHEAAAHGVDGSRRNGHVTDERSWQRFLGRYLLQVGRLAEAAATLDGSAVRCLDAVVTVDDAAALVARGRVAIHTGDHRTAAALLKISGDVGSGAAPELRRHTAWFLALSAMAAGDATRASAHLRDLEGDGADSVVPLLLADGADYPQLVRLARDASDGALAHAAVDESERRRELNPGIGAIAAAAAHARGLLEGSADALYAAAELFADGPRLLPKGSALEDAGAALHRDGDRTNAVAALGDALGVYTEAGATWDASRVRRRLRAMGVRRRLVKATRPTTGWAGLTDAEMAVVRLVAEGLTNREVAERLFISPHTASMHLRHVFTKLQINSRVELARLAAEYEAAA